MIGRLAIVGLLVALAGCNPIQTYRNWVGVSANDPNPETTANTKNLAAGEARSYPNLATVPPPPTQALTTAQLNKLTQDLIADRANAKYTSEHLQAQFDESAAPPPPSPAPPAPSLAGETPATPSVAGRPPPSPAGAALSVSKPPAAQAGANPATPGSTASALAGHSRQSRTKLGAAARTRTDRIESEITANSVSATAAVEPTGATATPRIVGAGCGHCCRDGPRSASADAAGVPSDAGRDRLGEIPAGAATAQSAAASTGAHRDRRQQAEQAARACHSLYKGGGHRFLRQHDSS